jgi:hypothetical protein
MESMFRCRAVESPPDDHGTRTIWHRGLNGAELMTQVDGTGLVTRQELSLFNDVIVWVAGTIKTGESTMPLSKRPTPTDGLTFDTEGGATRVYRIAAALKHYRGTDRSIQHVRAVLGVADEGAVPTTAPATGNSPAVIDDLSGATQRSGKHRSQLAVIGIVLGGLLILMGIMMLWRSMGS